MDEKNLEQVQGIVDTAVNRHLIATAVMFITVLVALALIIVL